VKSTKWIMQSWALLWANVGDNCLRVKVCCIESKKNGPAVHALISCRGQKDTRDMHEDFFSYFVMNAYNSTVTSYIIAKVKVA
jgi:hypothetical protein